MIVIAVLTTKCGCEKRMQIPMPPQNEILIPLLPKMKMFESCEVGDIDAPLQIQCRRFVRNRQEQRGEIFIVHYSEV